MALHGDAQQEADLKLSKILTPEQVKQFTEMRRAPAAACRAGNHFWPCAGCCARCCTQRCRSATRDASRGSGSCCATGYARAG